MLAEIFRAAATAGLIVFVAGCWVFAATRIAAAMERARNEENLRALRRSGWRG